MCWFDDLLFMLLSECKIVFSDLVWVYELKFDGYRLLVEVDVGCCILWLCSGVDVMFWFFEVVVGLVRLLGYYVFDGEVLVFDDIGCSDFDWLYVCVKCCGFWFGFDLVVFCVFDVLVVDGLDVMI